jgi:uncharacterized oligopeptide transporter (OPT) family protein
MNVKNINKVVDQQQQQQQQQQQEQHMNNQNTEQQQQQTSSINDNDDINNKITKKLILSIRYMTAANALHFASYECSRVAIMVCKSFVGMCVFFLIVIFFLICLCNICL